MILVTLGTHPQPMDRLIVEIDDLIERGAIREHVIIQAAAFERLPRYAEAVGVVPYADLQRWMVEATRIICHGGPASIMAALAVGKRPVVVPRDPDAGEQVDDHQIRFVRWLAARSPIVPLWNVTALQEALDAESLTEPAASTPALAVRRLIELVESRSPAAIRPLTRDTSPPVLMVASVRQHIDVFAPVARHLADLGAAASVLTLDRWYGQGAEAAAANAGLEVLPIAATAPASSGSFYRRSTLAIWRDVLEARPALEDAISRASTPIVVLGNDSGLLEKVVVGAARRVGSRTALIQDGRLAARRPRAPNARAAVVATGRRLLAPLVRWLGAPFLAASEFGAGGADRIFASGDLGARILRSRSPRSTTVVTGQPKYDRLIGRQLGGDAAGPVAMFTTPFADAGLGAAPQAAQLALMHEMAAELRRSDIAFVVKPHPREDPDTYRRIAGATVVAGDAADVLGRCSVAVIGISTVVEEAGLLGAPVLVPGRVVHGHRFDEHLPDGDAFPRFETAAELARLVVGLRDPRLRRSLAARQAERIRREVAFDAAKPAGRVIAEQLVMLGAAVDGA